MIDYLCCRTALFTTLLLTAGPSWADCDPQKPRETPTSRYELRGPEAYDTQTKLTWQRCAVGQRWDEARGCLGEARKMTWEEAMDEPQGPWRLPTIEQLDGISASGCKNPPVNARVFPNAGLADYWSRSTAAVFHYNVGGWTQFNADNDPSKGLPVAWILEPRGSKEKYRPYSEAAVRLVREGR